MADISQWTGVAADVLNNYLNAENGEEGAATDAGNFGVDAFVNEFEDEFPSDPASGELYPNYSPEAQRAAEQKPWGLEFGNRPKVYELNQPAQAQLQGWRIIDLYPNRDIKNEFYRLGGTPAELRILIQSVMGARQLLKNNNLIIDFKEWFKLWEEGFPGWNRTDSNFELTGQAPWRKVETRPRYREWTAPAGSSIGYRVIEYWPNRQNEKTSYFLTGSDADLVRHILQIEYEGGAEQKSGKLIQDDIKILSGHPQIDLYFRQEEDINLDFGPAEAEISFRLMNKVESSEFINFGESVLSISDLKSLARSIESIFINSDGTGFTWKKGKQAYCYHHWQLGYHFQLFCQSDSEAERVAKAILAIQGHIFKPQWMSGGKSSLAPEIVYSENPGSHTVLGKQEQKPRRRPKVDVVFKWARCWLTYQNEEIVLASRGNSRKKPDTRLGN